MNFFLRELHQYKVRKQQAGFTVIEAFVGIAILLVGIVGPMTLVNDNMQAGRFSRDQITSYYLAQEAIEIIRQQRDDNMLSGGNWLAGLADGSDNCFNGCMVDGRADINDQKKIKECPGGLDNCASTINNLGINNAGQYGYGSGN